MRKCLALCVCALCTGYTTGCGTEPVCTLDVIPAVVVEIRDGFDATPLAATARGAVQEGEFADSLQPYRSVGNGVLVSRAAGWEREGLYSVTVEHAGYADWRRDGVGVRQRNECHVETVELTAYLQRTP